jgi:hypothetical protein
MSEGIELRIYSYENPDKLLDTIEGRKSPKVLDEIDGVGGGSFEVSKADPKVRDNPQLLDYRNIAQIVIDQVVVGEFMIQNKETKVVSEGERSVEGWAISGPGLLQWFDDADVKPAGGIKPQSFDSRSFNFASERGDWYVDSDWRDAYQQGGWGSAPRGERPDKWPEDRRATWIWGAEYDSRFSAPPSSITLFRYEFSTSVEATFIFYFAGDDYLNAWVDGQQVITKNDKKSIDFDNATRIEMKLSPGSHIIGAQVQNDGRDFENNPASLMMAAYKFNNGVEDYFFSTRESGWKTLYQPDPQPGWTPGELILDLMAEARDRGVRSMAWFKPTFTTKLDSNGQPWVSPLDWTFKVGEDSYLSVVNKIREMGYKVWVSPGTRKLNIAPTRGSRRDVDPDAVVFEMGKNLRSAKSQGVGKVKNKLMFHTPDGWVVREDADSLGKYGTLEGSVETDLGVPQTELLAKALFHQRATPEEGASYDVIIRPNDEVPFRDYFVGDWVLAPNDLNIRVPREVVSLSAEEGPSGRPLYTIEFDTIFRSNEQKMAMVLGKSGGTGIGATSPSTGGGSGGSGAPIIIPPSSGGAPRPSTPKAPTNVKGTSTGSWSVNGVTATSQVALTWDPVTVNIDNREMSVAYYEVWAFLEGNRDSIRQVATSTTTSTIAQPFEPGTKWVFMVKAISALDIPSTYSASTTITMLGPTTPLPAPDQPILMSDQGLLVVTWNGLLNGQAPPPQFRYVYAEVSKSTEGPWVRSGPTVSREGREMILPGLEVGTTYWVRLFAVDGLGIASARSLLSSTVIKGVDLGAINEQLEENLEQTRDAVSQVRENTNVVEDADFERGDQVYWDWHDTNVSSSSNRMRSGTKSLRMVTVQGAAYEAFRYMRWVPAAEGDTYYFRIYVLQSSGILVNSGVELSIVSAATPTAADNVNTAIGSSKDLVIDQWVLLSGTWTVPAGTKYFKPRVVVRDATTGNVYYVDDVRIIRMADNTTIVDGSINADKLAADSVVAGKIAADSVAAVNIQAQAVTAEKITAGAITAEKLAVGAVTANTISAGAVQTSHISPSVGKNLDISANNAVTIIAGQVKDTQAGVDATGQELETMQTYYEFGPSGAVISTPDSPMTVAIRSDRIEMIENGNVISYWNSGQLYVDQMIGSRVILGNHQLEKYSTGTVVRAL